MLNNIYVYKYMKYTDIVRKVEEYQFNKIDYYENIEVYSIYNLKSKSLIECEENNTVYLYDKFNLYIFKNEKIVVFTTKKYQYIKRFCNDKNLVKYNLLSVECFKLLASKDFSRSLTNLNIQFDYIDNEGEDFELIGSEIDGMEVIYDMGFKGNYENIKIKSYSIQPLKCNYLINIRSVNRIEVKKKCSENEIIETVIKLITTISAGGIDKYGKYMD
ncbi:hypothetical protein [Romboutsia sp. 1001216sp1]|uniref:hypothetical protein n=1 Tax=Romboutsia sp. 1001216sp1 TaxID=2986997 RepID=UPI00232ACCBD|nr:hypothetical protein [Romboutsia sp. 1001216sp1]MDB8804419.1 hypothetical protein [Romboutsia sp. 1001216sp1]MDB8806657.1 hypothetical protein [Romboutsia sp. 1001216sp1]MDB8810067.1 hypothetical protein [Romboutsia sp. 1001216sp1]MDB8815814.1 hypothetical protein [Romboutsia sp. 1001216sp1]MDB8818264.1 hypothetical protein [Romboutsia sp. 1001216sp1]